MRGFKRISSEIITVLLDLRFVKSFLLLQFEGVLILINTEIIITKEVKTFILHDALIFSLIRELCIFFSAQKITVDPKSKSAGARIFKAVSPRRIKHIQHIYNRPHI